MYSSFVNRAELPASDNTSNLPTEPIMSTEGPLEGSSYRSGTAGRTAIQSNLATSRYFDDKSHVLQDFNRQTSFSHERHQGILRTELAAVAKAFQRIREGKAYIRR